MDNPKGVVKSGFFLSGSLKPCQDFSVLKFFPVSQVAVLEGTVSICGVVLNPGKENHPSINNLIFSGKKKEKNDCLIIWYSECVKYKVLSKKIISR